MRFDIYRERERTYTVEKWVVVGEGQLYAIQFAEHCAATFSLSLSAVCIFDRGDMARQWGVISYADHVISALKNQHWPLGSLIFFLSYQGRSCLLPVHTKLSLSLSLRFFITRSQFIASSARKRNRSRCNGQKSHPSHLPAQHRSCFSFLFVVRQKKTMMQLDGANNDKG